MVRFALPASEAGGTPFFLTRSPLRNLLQPGTRQERLAGGPPASSSWERSIYPGSMSGPSRETFAVIAFMPNLTRTGHLLVIGGLNMPSTQAAADRPLEADIIRPIIEKAQLPGGSLEPFELLIETSSLGAEALPSRIIAARHGM